MCLSPPKAEELFKNDSVFESCFNFSNYTIGIDIYCTYKPCLIDNI